MLKRLLLILAFAGFLASCSSSKVALETSQDKDVITKDETRYESLSSTLAVEVKDDNTEAVSTTRKAGNTATITVIDCDKELANESESGLESESELESE